MKVKIRFRGIVLPFWKRLKISKLRAHFAKDPELYYAFGLLLLWLIIFIIIHL